VDDQVIAGAVTLVAHEGRTVSLEAVGQADLDSQKPMRPNQLFWIASMTKPMTAVCVLLLQDEGKLSVDDPVEKHLPEFKDLWLVEERAKDRLVLKRPARVITIKDLLTHTSGLGNMETPRPTATLAELVGGYAKLPLQFEPGSRWQYSNPGINTLGRLVEVVSGMPFAEFMDQRLFRPLGMNQTTFWPTPAQQKRIATSYQPASSGKGLEPTEVTFLRGAPLEDRNRTPYPAGGLYSTAEDVAKFYQMMLDGGVARGKRLLSASAVRQLTTTQTGDIKTGFTEGMSWGLGFQVVKEPQGVTAMLSPGTFGHGGAYGTQSWADPRTKTIYVLMIQRARLGNSDGSDLRKAFQAAAAAAIR
jgi:CubicO group peptidase (beta-lactamase class C family)